MPIGSERAAVQNPFLRYATEAGWTYLTPNQALELRRGLTSPVLETVLVAQLQKLNPGIVDHLMITVAKRLIEDPIFENPTVLMLVDRNELEAQLFGNLEAIGFGQVEVARSKQHLR
ncbi:MAG: type I restriction endonuclease subunit R, partial [Candidatus Binatia bacterium]